MLGASGLVMLSVPAIAGPHEGGDHDRGEKIKAMLQEIDKDGDGAISKDEYMNHARAKAEERFAEKDANGDGKISPEEGKAHMEKKREEMKEKREGLRDKIKEKRQERMEDKKSDADAE